MLACYASSGQRRSTIFPKGPKADGWFGLAKTSQEGTDFFF